MTKETSLYPANPVLLVDDEPSLLQSLRIGLTIMGINNIITLTDSSQAMSVIQEKDVDAVVLDMIMPHLSGEELLEQIRNTCPEVPVIMLTGVDDLETAVRLMRLNAFDYIVKPAKKEKLAASLKNALELRGLKRQNRILSQHVQNPGVLHPENFEGIITCDERMLNIFRYIEAISPSREPVLITGETGTGKELVAKSLHDSAGVKGDFVAVNVAGLDDHVFSDTLFGHVKGAFTGADRARPGFGGKRLWAGHCFWMKSAILALGRR